jgi:hypothetical protein
MLVSGLVTYFLANGAGPVKLPGMFLAFMPVLLKLFAAVAVDQFGGIGTEI